MINKASIDGNNNIVVQDTHGSTIIIHTHKPEDIKQLNQEQLIAVQALMDENTDVMFDRIKSFLKSFVPDKPFPKNLTAYASIAKEDIVGREDDLKELHRRLLENKKLSLINGMGGIGKTTLAAVYVDTYATDYDHIAWLTIESSLEDAIIASHDLLTNLKLQDTPPEKLLSACLNQLRNIHSKQPALLVLDNATERLAKLYHSLPKAPNWHVLVTSREIIEPFSIMELGFLTEAEAILLFQKYNHNFTEEEVRNFVQEVEYHTLTIEILAKSSKKNRWDAETVKRAISIDARAGIATSHSGHEKIDRIKSYLVQIFQISSLDEQEEYVLKQFTALPNQWISYDLLKTLLQVNQLGWKDDFPGTLETLYEKGYILKDEEKDSYKMHPVLVEALIPQFKTNSKDFQLLVSSVKRLLSLDQTKENPTSKFPYIHFGEALLKRIPDNDYPDITNLKNNLALRYKDLGRFNTSKTLLEQAIEAGIAHYGINHPAVVRRKSNLAIIYQDLGQYEEAKELFEQTLKSEITNFGEKHPNLARTKSNLGLVYRDLGQYETAKKLLEQALASDIINYGKDHPTVAIRQSNLALVYSSLGQYENARDLLEQALAIIVSNYEEKHPYVARAQLNLATVYQNLGKYEKAKDLLEQALETDIVNYGEKHPNVTRTQSNLATVYQNIGNNKKAKDLLEQALKTDIANFGEKHPNVSRIQSNLAMIYKDLGQYETARDLLEKALASDINKYGDEHPYVAIRQSNLAIVYQALGQYEKAKALWEQAYTTCLYTVGEHHPYTKTFKSYLEQMDGK